MINDKMTRDALMLETINALCQKTKITPSALLLLNFPFTDTQLIALDEFLNQNLFNHQVLSTETIAQQLHTIRPAMSAADYHFLAADLIQAWQAEDRYRGLVFE